MVDFIFFANLKLYNREYFSKIFERVQQNMRSYTIFFMSNTFISNVRLKLVKYQAKAKQYPETEFLLFENYSLF